MKLQKLVKAWFKLPDDAENAEIEIKHLRAGEIDKIVQSSHSQSYRFEQDKDGVLKPVSVVEANNRLERTLTITETITDWRGILDQDGQPLACNEENKNRLCRELSESDFLYFCNFFQDCRKKLAEAIEAERACDLGN